MGQNQGKISEKKHKKAKGLKHAKVPKKKTKKKSAKKMGKLAEEVYQEETGDWIEESSGFNEANKETLGAKSVEHDSIGTYANTKGENQVEVNVHAENIHQDEDVEGDEEEKSVVLSSSGVAQIPIADGKIEELNVKRNDEQFKTVQSLAPESDFSRQEYEAVNDSSETKKQDSHRDTLGHLDKRLSSKNDVTEGRMVWPKPDRPFKQDCPPLGHQNQDNLSHRRNERYSLDLKLDSVESRNPSHEMTDKLTGLQEVMKYLEQDDRKDNPETFIATQNDTIIKHIGKEEATERKFERTSDMRSSSGSSGHRYQKAARNKHEKPPRQKYGKTSSKKKEIISLFLFLLNLNDS